MQEKFTLEEAAIHKMMADGKYHSDQLFTFWSIDLKEIVNECAAITSFKGFLWRMLFFLIYYTVL